RQAVELLGHTAVEVERSPFIHRHVAIVRDLIAGHDLDGSTGADVVADDQVARDRVGTAGSIELERTGHDGRGPEVAVGQLAHHGHDASSLNRESETTC